MAVPAAGATPGLRPGVLKVRHAVITSLAVITPAAAILFLPIPIAANAGAAMPLSIIVAFVVVFVIMNGIIVAHGGPDIPWWLLMLIGLVLIWGVAVLGIRLSVRSDLVLLAFELAVLLALAITILAKGAPGGDWHAHVFNPDAAPSGFG